MGSTFLWHEPHRGRKFLDMDNLVAGRNGSSGMIMSTKWRWMTFHMEPHCEKKNSREQTLAESLVSYGRCEKRWGKSNIFKGGKGYLSLFLSLSSLMIAMKAQDQKKRDWDGESKHLLRIELRQRDSIKAHLSPISIEHWRKSRQAGKQASRSDREVLEIWRQRKWEQIPANNFIDFARLLSLYLFSCLWTFIRWLFLFLAECSMWDGEGEREAGKEE